MVDMRVGEDHAVQLAGMLHPLGEVQFLERARALEHPAIDQQPRAILREFKAGPGDRAACAVDLDRQAQA